jgi:hypothetical protein
MSRVLRTQKAIYALIAMVAVILIIVGVVAYQVYLSLMRQPRITPTPPPAPQPTQFVASLPVKFTISDKWAGGSPGATSITVYKADTLEQFDSGTADSSTGVWTSNKAMKTGEQYWVKLSLSNALIYYKVTIPYATSTGQVYHYISLDFYTLGAYAITAQLSNGTVLSDGATLNLTKHFGGSTFTTVTFTIMIRNTETADSGLMDFFDPIKNMQRETIFYFKVSGNQYEQLIVKNVPMIYQSANARYYGMKIDPWKLVLDKDPLGAYNTHNGEELDGIYTFNVQFDVSGITAGADGPEIEFYLYTFDNFDYFKTYGTDLSDALELQATDYNIEIDG